MDPSSRHRPHHLFEQILRPLSPNNDASVHPPGLSCALRITPVSLLKIFAALASASPQTSPNAERCIKTQSFAAMA